MSGKAAGASIDAHDVVVRLNQVRETWNYSPSQLNLSTFERDDRIT